MVFRPCPGRPDVESSGSPRIAPGSDRVYGQTPPPTHSHVRSVAAEFGYSGHDDVLPDDQLLDRRDVRGRELEGMVCSECGIECLDLAHGVPGTALSAAAIRCQLV